MRFAETATESGLASGRNCHACGVFIGKSVGTARAIARGMKTYQELVVWQLADELRKEIYRLLRDTPAAGDLRFADQLRGAVSSISSNIVEGFRRYGSVEFARYLEIAFASAGETADWLDDGVARGHWIDDEVAAARQLLRRINPALTHLMRYLRSPQARSKSRRT